MSELKQAMIDLLKNQEEQLKEILKTNDEEEKEETNE